MIVKKYSVINKLLNHDNSIYIVNIDIDKTLKYFMIICYLIREHLKKNSANIIYSSLHLNNY